MKDKGSLKFKKENVVEKVNFILMIILFILVLIPGHSLNERISCEKYNGTKEAIIPFEIGSAYVYHENERLSKYELCTLGLIITEQGIEFYNINSLPHGITFVFEDEVIPNFYFE